MNKQSSKRIERILRKVFLENKYINYELYESELEGFISECKENAIKDEDEYTYVVTERNGAVAMFLINKNDELYINEKALDKLKKLWKHRYTENIELFIPIMVEMIDKGYFAVNGVTFSDSNDK